MISYDDIADLLDKAAEEHLRAADLLSSRDNPSHAEANSTLAEVLHSGACRRAAQALRGRKPIQKPA